MNRKVLSLLDLAARDVAHAQDNLRAHPAHAAWSIQQAAEKMIKAILGQARVSHPATTHQLDVLVALVPAGNPFRADLLDLTRLSASATKYRYPTPSGLVPEDPPLEEMVEDLRKIALLLPEVRAWIEEHDR